MQATVVSRQEQVVIQLSGRFDFNAHREFRDAVEKALKLDQNEVVVDLAGVDYLDSSALGMLLLLRDKANARDKAVALSNSIGPAKQVIEIANFGKLFTLL